MEKNILLKIHNLSKTYGKKNNQFFALKNLNFKIEKGESLAIVGKSGSGKSTLMHLLALLDKPSSGNIYFNGEDTAKLKTRTLNHLRNREFGFVFQSFFTNPNDSVLNNVILPLKIGGIPFRERKRRALAAIKTVELTDKIKSKTIDLSGGQKQRVCIARAIVTEPNIIFADEPTGNLDTNTGSKIMKLLFDLNRKKGITLILVTHDIELAKLCNRQILLSDGEIISDKKGQKS